MPRNQFLRRRARQFRREQTSAETQVWWLLRDRRLAGLKFRRTAELEQAGYRVIRFGNHVIYDKESQIVDAIMDAIKDSALPAVEKARLERDGLFPN
jgi:very-short-patch-repair endonuclease